MEIVIKNLNDYQRVFDIAQAGDTVTYPSGEIWAIAGKSESEIRFVRDFKTTPNGEPSFTQTVRPIKMPVDDWLYHLKLNPTGPLLTPIDKLVQNIAKKDADNPIVGHRPRIDEPHNGLVVPVCLSEVANVATRMELLDAIIEKYDNGEKEIIVYMSRISIKSMFDNSGVDYSKYESSFTWVTPHGDVSVRYADGLHKGHVVIKGSAS